MSFRDAMKHVYEENPFPLRKRDLEHELSHPVSLGLEEEVCFSFLFRSQTFYLLFHWVISLSLTMQIALITSH